jgi:hypothetical protein
VSQQLTATQVEQTERDAMIKRQRDFAQWLHKGMQYRATGRNIAYIRQYHPWPHKFDEYELKRAIEEGLA